MSRAPLPECRGSHLAGARERLKAIKLYRRHAKPRQTERRDQMPIAEQNVVPMKKKRARTTQRRCLPQEIVARLLSQRNSIGIVACLTAMRRHDPHATDGGLRTRWNVLAKGGAEHSWTQGHLNIWMQLDREFRGIREQKTQSTVAAVPRVPVLDIQKPTATTSPMTQMIAVMQQQQAAMVELMKMFAEQQNQPPALPTHTEPRTKEFGELQLGHQRSIVNSMMRRVANEQLLPIFGDIKIALAEAWNNTYEKFDLEYGLRTRERASELNDTNGRKCRPLDIIEADGNLERFYEIIQRMWFKAE